MSAGNGTTTFANAAYTYDAMGRIATVGNSADTLTYSYVPGTNMIGSATWQEASINTVNTYDQYKRLTNIAVNNTSVYGYTLNDKNQRTGATLPDGRTWSYSYDTLGQLTGAVKRDSANTQLADLSYLYDQIGNRTSATENNTTTTYTSNLVNQYTQIASQVPTYDADGNMTSYNGWTYTWNGENRLVAAENSDTRLEFSYDYMGRRLEKKVYSKGLLTLYDWSLEKHRKFVYDGYKLIAEFEVEDDNATLFASYLWQPEAAGLDVPLMRIADNTQTYYIADGNKNIIALKDSSGADVSTYSYTPFGALEEPTVEDENPFRFSSEYADDETGLVYYNYRYYSPQLGRWTKRDPIEEEGGVNLYRMGNNNSISTRDHLGLEVFNSITIKQKDILWSELFSDFLIPDFLKTPSYSEDPYGHWWIEMGSESYGWWPKGSVNFFQTVISVPGILNAGQAKDPHHGDKPNTSFNPRRATFSWYNFWSSEQLQYGPDPKPCCKKATESQIKDCIRSFATNYKGRWSYPWGPNCHTFVNDAMSACCLEK